MNTRSVVLAFLVSQAPLLSSCSSPEDVEVEKRHIQTLDCGHGMERLVPRRINHVRPKSRTDNALLPNGYAIAGAHLASDNFLCRMVQTEAQEADTGHCWLESTYTSNEYPWSPHAMRACPRGSYFKGYHDQLSKGICCHLPPGNQDTNWRVDGVIPPDTTTGRWYGKSMFGGTCAFQVDVHTCGVGEVVEGINRNDNDFICAS